MANYSSCSWVGDSALEQGSSFVVCQGCKHMRVGESGAKSLQTGTSCIGRNKPLCTAPSTGPAEHLEGHGEDAGEEGKAGRCGGGWCQTEPHQLVWDALIKLGGEATEAGRAPGG